jgi:hypothetical protein
MSNITIGQKKMIAFVLVDTSGTEVTGLDDTFSVEISKNSGALAAGAGTKAEIGSGWYSYELTAGETDTEGPLAIVITGTGAVQQNLLYYVSGSIWSAPAGSYILTSTEAAAILRCAEDDANLLMLLPQVDAYIKQATGRDWALDDPVRPEAKAAARILLVQAHEDPGGLGQAPAGLSWGLRACLTQLEALAMLPEISGVPDEPLELMQTNIGDWMALDGDLVLVFNHPMADAAISKVYLQTGDGSSVTCTNSLDTTKKILRISPNASLSSNASYWILVDYAPDVYGQTLYQTVAFMTAG